MRLLLGNAAPIDVLKSVDHEAGVETLQRVQRDDLGAQVTTVDFPDRDLDHKTFAAIVKHDDPHAHALKAVKIKEADDPDLHAATVGAYRDLAAIHDHPRFGPKMRSLSPAQRHFYLHRDEVDDLWWQGHSDLPPEWVESDDEPELAKLIAAHFTTKSADNPDGHVCHVGRPKTWTEGRDLPDGYGFGGGVSGAGLPAVQTRPVSSVVPVTRLAQIFEPTWPEVEQRIRESGDPTMLRTNGGTDKLSDQHLSTSAQPASFNYVAVTANATAPSAADTTLTAEITTAGGGLIRKQATYAHTTGTSTSTLSATFTANGTDSLPVTLAKFGIFNASSSGTMGYESAISPTATLSASGDNLALTDTFTFS